MAKPKPRKTAPTAAPRLFDQARDELFSHILRCGVLEALPEHQKEWFDDTMLYLEDLSEEELGQLRVLGERYCQPVMNRPQTPSTEAETETASVN
jgi:hypothetical protein